MQLAYNERSLNAECTKPDMLLSPSNIKSPDELAAMVLPALPLFSLAKLLQKQKMNTVPIMGRIPAGRGKDLVTRDRARAQKFLKSVNPHGPVWMQEYRRMGRQRAAASSSGVDVTDAGVTFTASVGVGNPATNYTLLIDTG